jgi:hypothetical protein
MSRHERAPRFAALVVGLVVLVLASGCSSVRGGSQTGADLQGAGYRNVFVYATSYRSLQTGQASEAVSVVYSRGPTGDDGQDAQRAEKIIWETEPGPVTTLWITKNARKCVARACSTTSVSVGSASRAQLAAAFGPRPHGLDTASATRPSASPPRDEVLTVAASAAVLALVVIALVVIIARRRRKRAPQGPVPRTPPWPPLGPQPEADGPK